MGQLSEVQIRRRIVASSGFVELGLYQEAIEELAELPDNTKDNVMVLAAWLQIYQAWGKWAEGAAVAERLIEKEPDQADWYVALAFATRRAQSLSAAEVILSAALKKFPEDATINFNLACYYAQLGELDKSRFCLERAIQIDDRFKMAALTDPDLRPLRD